jgi:ribosomal 50S subunit-recycling heat shock protein
MFRLNKCIPAVSRRTADKLIQEGMVDINDSPAHLGDMISFGDILRVGGKVVDWQSLMRSKMSTEMVSPHSLSSPKFHPNLGEYEE